MTEKNIVNEWINFSLDDLNSAKILIKEKKGNYNIPLFHIHQSIEKLLKGALLYHNLSFPYVHDIEMLLNLLIKKIKDIENFRDFILEVNYLYPKIRYPIGLEIDKSKAEQLLKLSQKFFILISSSLKRD